MGDVGRRGGFERIEFNGGESLPPGCLVLGTGHLCFLAGMEFHRYIGMYRRRGSNPPSYVTPVGS